MNTMSYKGYSATVAFDEDDEIFVGRIAGIAYVVGFHAESVAEFKVALAAELYGQKPQSVGWGALEAAANSR